MLNPHWDAVQKMIEGFLELYPEAEYEFAHIVLSDYNLSDDDIAWARAAAYKTLVDSPLNELIFRRVMATSEFLGFLLSIPEDWRMPTREE